jgi:hypothetical protein
MRLAVRCAPWTCSSREGMTACEQWHDLVYASLGVMREHVDKAFAQEMMLRRIDACGKVKRARNQHCRYRYR